MTIAHARLAAFLLCSSTKRHNVRTIRGRRIIRQSVICSLDLETILKFRTQVLLRRVNPTNSPEKNALAHQMQSFDAQKVV
jgi:hypothetical protein